MQIPDLSGQPPWVVVVVTLLFVAGWVGARWVSRGRAPDSELEEDADAARPLPSEGVASPVAVPAEHHTTAVILRTLDLLHAEAQESRDGREDAARWREEAQELRRQLDDCQEQLGELPGRHGRMGERASE